MNILLLLICLSALVLGIAQRNNRGKFITVSAIAAVLTIWLSSHHPSQPSAQITPSPLPVAEVSIKPQSNSPTPTAISVLTEKPAPKPKPPSPKLTPKPIHSPKPSPSPTPETQVSTPLRASVAGSCECPYDTDKRGRSCGGRSAYSRPGGRAPKCYSTD